MSEQLKKLKALLAELFQLDQAELDFGIYRIMNTKREEITRFLDNDLLPQIREAFQAYEAENRGAVEAELAEAIEKAKELGADPETLPRVKELRAKLVDAVDVAALENEVFSHLYNFFRRYYSEGDFISQRRYKEGVYAIPYEGEEVKLYWANHDQYYIKTTEYLRNYTFKLPSGRRVHFKLVDADTDKDNNRAPNGNERRFILSQEQPLAEENGELVIRFDYRPHPDKAKQADLNAAAVDRILNQTTGFDDWRRELASLRPTEKNANRTLLEKHLTDYTARNTFDYFIHKDLGGFLRRELDFYIKNEVMHLDDIENETAPRVEQYLSKIKAIRRIAHKIIDFLAQIENFQKKLWLKKKFVVETQYCITLDRIFAIEDEKTKDCLLEQIVKNDAQREEWVRLFAINEIKGDLTTPGYAEPLTVTFLKTNAYLVLDTRYFREEFRTKLLASFDDLEARSDGLLVHGENFQALNLLLARYREQVNCIYIDPPFNTGKDEFLYKDTYLHSSWLTMMLARAALAWNALNAKGFLAVSIADHEQSRLKLILDTVFGAENFIATMVWNTEGNIDNQSKFKGNHEYILLYAKQERSLEAPAVIDPNVPQDSKLYRETIENSITKNGPANPPSTVTLPVGFPAAFEEGEVATDAAEWPKLSNPVQVAGSRTLVAVEATSGWSSRYLLDKFLENNCEPVLDSKGNRTWFKLTKTGAIYGYKERPKAPSHVLSVIRNVGTVKQMAGQLAQMGFAFSYPKPIGLIEYVTKWSNASDGHHWDFFAGSGTTAHAVINVNNERKDRRRYCLVEMGEYFDTVLLPRIKKVVYSKDWKDGKPVSRQGISHMFKYIRLESYEDTLNNLELKRMGPQQTLLEQHAAFREDYMLRYMLDVESRGSASLLNIDRFEDPFNYKLNIGTGTAGETKPTVVDLVETFNYLIGLRVKTIDDVRGVRVVTGTNPQGERVLILWRKIREMDNDALDAWFEKQGYNTKDQEYDVIYVNGDNNLENLRRADQTWKVRLIEEEFKRLMFDVQDI